MLRRSLERRVSRPTARASSSCVRRVRRQPGPHRRATDPPRPCTGRDTRAPPARACDHLLGVQLDQRTSLRERDERDLERCLLGRDQIAGLEGALESCAGMSLRSHKHTFSRVRGGDHPDMSVAAGRRTGPWALVVREPPAGLRVFADWRGGHDPHRRLPSSLRPPLEASPLGDGTEPAGPLITLLGVFGVREPPGSLVRRFSDGLPTGRPMTEPLVRTLAELPPESRSPTTTVTSGRRTLSASKRLLLSP